MRELKFRAWLPGIKKMTYSFDLFTVPGNGDDLCGAEIMQFTGLKDREGKEIWEGDILKDTETKDIYWAVSFEYGRFGIRFFVGPSYNPENLGKYHVAIKPRQKCIEVLGNIHENPELLNSPTEEVR